MVVDTIYTEFSIIQIKFNLNKSNQLINMKCIVALFALIAVASAGYVAPAFYNAPYAYGAYPYAAHAYAGHAYAAPYAYAAPIAHTYAAAPIAHTYAAAPVAAIPSGYVAQTRGSLHVAPHPEGPFTASHHINTAPAPGTL